MEIVGKGDVGEVFDVFVEVVDEGGELLGLGGEGGGSVVVFGGLGDGDRLFVDPHLDIGFEEVRVLFGVFGDYLCNGGSPGRKRHVSVRWAWCRGMEDWLPVT